MTERFQTRPLYPPNSKPATEARLRRRARRGRAAPAPRRVRHQMVPPRPPHTDVMRMAILVGFSGGRVGV